MMINTNNGLPFIDENLTKGIVDLKIFIHENIYSDEKCIDIITNEIKNIIGLKTNVTTAMDGSFKTLLLELDDADINIDLDQMIPLAFVNAFNNSYIINKLNLCNNKYKSLLTQTGSMNLFINIITIGNLVKIYL